MTPDRTEKTKRSGLGLLESYLVPGYVSFEECSEGEEKTLKPVLSPALKRKPKVLNALKEDVMELTAFVKSVYRDPALTGLSGSGETCPAGAALLNGFRQGTLLFFRDGAFRPTVSPAKAFRNAFRDYRALLTRFVQLVNEFGPRDAELLYSETEDASRDSMIRLGAPKRNEYDTENPEFTFTFLPDPAESESERKRSEAVRDNAAFALQRTTELLEDMVRTDESAGKEES